MSGGCLGPQGSLLGGIQVTLGLSERHLGWHWFFGVSWDPKSPPISPPPVLELSLTHRLGPVPLANELLAFVTSKDLDPRLTLDCLAAFEHEVRTPKKPRNHPKKEAEGGHVRPPLFFFPPGPRQEGQQSLTEIQQPPQRPPRRPLPAGAVSFLGEKRGKKTKFVLKN